MNLYKALFIAKDLRRELLSAQNRAMKKRKILFDDCSLDEIYGISVYYDGYLQAIQDILLYVDFREEQFNKKRGKK